MPEIHEGKKEGSIISVATQDSLEAGERETLRTSRKELEEIGISHAAFEANKDFIFRWLRGLYNRTPSGTHKKFLFGVQTVYLSLLEQILLYVAGSQDCKLILMRLHL